ncbi:MAG TPA: ATP synthase F0 subunit B, partial [Acidisarcina sp.]
MSSISIRPSKIRLCSFRLPVLLFVAVFLAFGQAGRALAEEPGQTTTASAHSASPGSATSDEQDSQNAFRHAAPVQWIARHLHVSVETAAKIFEDINSGVLILVIVAFLARKLPVAYRQRRETIQAALVDARTATEQANERLSVVEARLSRLDAEIEGIRQQAERDGAQDEIRIKQSLEEERRRIVESAEHEIESAGVAAQRRLKQFAAEL